MIVIGKKNCKNYFVCLLVYSYSLKKKYVKEIRKIIKINMCNLLYNNLLLFYDVWNIKLFKIFIWDFIEIGFLIVVILL